MKILALRTFGVSCVGIVVNFLIEGFKRDTTFTPFMTLLLVILTAAASILACAEAQRDRENKPS